MSGRLAYGWQHFDQERARAIKKESPVALKRGPGGGLHCPLREHEPHYLPWRGGDPWNGTEKHGTPRLSFRSTGTFILEDPLDNVIVDAELIAGAIRREWGKADTRRFGWERSEDAVSWNVFRSLQRAGLLPWLVERLVGAGDTSPVLSLWGTEVWGDEVVPWRALADVRAQVEPGYGIPTEPDVGLHVPGWGDILIEAKFGSGMSRRKNQPALEAFAAHYAKAAPCLLDPAKIVAVGYRRVPEQLLRNLTYACKLAERSGLRAHVVALVREGEAEDIEERVADCLVNPSEPFVTFSRVTWESIYAGLDQSNPDVRGLVTFFQQKSLYLSPAFAIPA